MIIHRSNHINATCDELKMMLKSFSTKINNERIAGKIPSDIFNMPPDFDDIDKAFEENDTYTITKMVLNVSKTFRRYLDLNDASQIIELALKSPLKNAVFEPGLFGTSNISCNKKLFQESQSIDFQLETVKDLEHWEELMTKYKANRR